MNSPDYLTAAESIAREAGEILLQYAEKRVAVEYKGSFDVVTAADRAAEELIVARLRSLFPRHSIVAEEGGGVENDGGWVWYVDPLDGTTNFAHSLPIFAVSLGLECDGKGVAGVVYDPTRDECFAAEAGSGAYLNHRRLHVSKISRLEESLLATGFPSARRHKDTNIHYFHQASMLSHGVRRPGSAALDLCSVAAGRLDGFWEFGLKAWDVSAGVVLVKEAGGRITDMQRGSYRSGGESLAATNGHIHDELLDLFGEVAEGRYRAPLPPVTAPARV